MNKLKLTKHSFSPKDANLFSMCCAKIRSGMTTSGKGVLQNHCFLKFNCYKMWISLTIAANLKIPQYFISVPVQRIKLKKCACSTTCVCSTETEVPCHCFARPAECSICTASVWPWGLQTRHKGVFSAGKIGNHPFFVTKFWTVLNFQIFVRTTNVPFLEAKLIAVYIVFRPNFARVTSH